ncbi:RRM_XMAS2 and SAC3_GANP domain-containing protein xmas [Arctopsyche grandis]|uniref:RRM_XMAS2 and SAC3_GANP domain-containing protein xmas n=1 Tax=Arctopsyche grandis TaxID=121162 RepID=UPI00406D8C80
MEAATQQSTQGHTFSISCSDIPDSLFDHDAAIEHFGKFGPIAKIVLQPKKKSCIIMYETRDDADKAILNAGAYDGFMFDVKLIKKRRPKPDDDPEWLPDPDVAAELASMGRNQTQVSRINRQQKMAVDLPSPIRPVKKSPVKRLNSKVIERKKTKSISKSSTASKSAIKPINSDELILLMSRAWITIDEKLKALEIRDKILRGCLKTRHGAIKGCCPDMCPEKERLLRQSQRQIPPYEMSSDNQATNRLDPKRAIKEYSRSSADQEEPLPHELRPVPVLHETLLYLLNYIVDLCEDPEESLSDWFHFMWDRLRAIRKDITQQALCCEGSIALVEICARFHAHCAARMIEEPSSSFDQRLNTENLLKCLQSLKYMYNDLRNRGEADACVCEPEFRGYVILLNLHDSNFMWEVQHLDPCVRSSPEVSFAIKVFTALDNNNYVRFFKLVRSTTYLNACILLRYFNDVRLQAVKRMIKASPRGSSYFPAYELLDTLAFEDLNSMGYFLSHYNVRINYADPNMPMVMFDRTSFSNNSEPYGPERAIKYVEAKRKCSIGETVYGKELVEDTFSEYDPHSSFDKNNYFKREAVLAEDQGHTPIPVVLAMVKKILNNTTIEKKSFEPKPLPITTNANNDKNFTFVFAEPKKVNDPPTIPSLFDSQTNNTVFSGNNVFKSANNDNADLRSSQNPFKSSTSDFIFSKPVLTDTPNLSQSNSTFISSSIFGNSANSGVQNKDNIFASKNEQNIFSSNSAPKTFESSSKNIFTRQINAGNYFGISDEVKPNNNIFGNTMESRMYPTVDQTKKMMEDERQNVFKNFSPSALVIPSNKFVDEEKQRLHNPFSPSARHVEEEKKRLAEEKRLEDIKRELQKQEERKRQMEEDLAKLARRKELERIEAEKKKKFEEFVESHSAELSSELIEESTKETCKYLIQEETQRLNDITAVAELTVKHMCQEIIDEECKVDIRKEVDLLQIRSRLRARRVVIKWKALVARSQKRRSLLINTPVWIHSQSPPIASPNQSDVLKRMRDFHHGKNCTFKLPTKSAVAKLDVFEIVKKYLMKRCQMLEQNPFSVDVYWKVVVDLPLDGETTEYSNFYHAWTKNAFSNCIQKADDNSLLYLSENYWYKKFLVSLCRLSDNVQLKSISEANGLLFYGAVNQTNLASFKERIDSTIRSKNKFDSVPVALILTPQTTDLRDSIEKHLMQFECRKHISAYKIYIAEDVTDALLSAHSIKALKWLALNCPPKPPLEMNELKSFLDQCIGSELWYRFKLSLNSSIRGAFESVEIVINLYNEAVDRTLKIACNEELKLYPTFAEEFKRYVTSSIPYPKDYEHFPAEWSGNMKVLKDVIASLKMPQYSGKWPPSNWQSFQVSIKSYIHLLNWYKDSERVFLKVLAIFLNVGGDDPDCSGFSWLDVMQLLVGEKIKHTFNKVVVYNKSELEHFRTTPWWYKSECTKNVCPFVEELEMDFLENTIQDLGINSSSKKRKLDTSADSIPDEDWLSTTLDHIDRSVSNNSFRKRMLEDLERSIQVESKRQAEIDALLKTAL